ncbi:hypothetical protein GCM10022238_06390 [Gordonia hankookensis]
MSEQVRDGGPRRTGGVVELDGAFFHRNENRLGHKEFRDRGELEDTIGVAELLDDPVRGDNGGRHVVDRPAG